MMAVTAEIPMTSVAAYANLWICLPGFPGLFGFKPAAPQISL